MREVILSDLVRHVLGPRGGPTERIKDPAFEYITGMLAPAGEGPQDAEDAVSEEGRSSIDQDDQYEAAVGELHPAAPALDPKSIPSTMGLSFFVETGDPRFEVCVTWARYEVEGDLWTRRPFHEVFRAGGRGGLCSTAAAARGTGGKPNCSSITKPTATPARRGRSACRCSWKTACLRRKKRVGGPAATCSSRRYASCARGAPR